MATDRLRALYRQGVDRQWNAAGDIDWSLAVDFGSSIPQLKRQSWKVGELPRGLPDHRFRWELQAWMVSQLLHGERGALLASARLVELLPDPSGRMFAATQCFDEARHVEVCERYLSSKLRTSYPPDPDLGALLADVLARSRWDLVYLGTQVILEAMALTALRWSTTVALDPLIGVISGLIARDEARHVSFGVIALESIQHELSARERSDHEELVLEGAVALRRGFVLAELWARLGVDTREGRRYALTAPHMVQLRKMMFRKVAAALPRLGLWTPRVTRELRALGLVG